MVSYGMDQAIEKLAPVGNPWAGVHANPRNPHQDPIDEEEAD